MKPSAHPGALRIREALAQRNVDVTVVEFESPTRTSGEAAAAIGCSVAEIAKSIVFRGAQSGAAILVIASGDNRVSETKVAALVGEPLARADPEFVRASTGYPIGGVAPVGHPVAVTLLLDADLRRFARVWAAGGTPHTVFAIAPDELQRATGAEWSDIRA